MIENGREKVADLELFMSCFSLDKIVEILQILLIKDIIIKVIFSMIIALKGYSNISHSKELDEIKEEIKVVQNEIKANKEYLKLLKTDKNVSSYLDKFTSNEEFENFKVAQSN